MKILNKLCWSICLLCLCLLPVRGLAAERDGINVTGAAETTVQADMAVIRGKVEAQKNTPGEAREAVAAKLAALKHTMLLSTISQQNWETSTYSLTPVYVVEGGKQKQRGFKAVSNVTIKVMNLDKLSKVLDSSITEGDLLINRVEFGLKDRKALEKSLLKEAVMDAREKAEIIALAGGRNLGPLVNATVMERMGDARIVMNSPMASLKSAGDSTPTELQPQNLKVRTSVNVLFSLIN